MEKVLRMAREYMTIGRKYKVRCINTRKITGHSSMDFYEVKDDLGNIQDVPGLMFRDLNQQELRQNRLKELGI